MSESNIKLDLKVLVDGISKPFVGLASDEIIKAELKKRGYAIDLEISFTVNGKQTNYKAIGKNPKWLKSKLKI